MEIIKKGESNPTKEATCDKCNARFKYSKLDVYRGHYCNTGNEYYYVYCPCCHYDQVVYAASAWFE